MCVHPVHISLHVRINEVIWRRETYTHTQHIRPSDRHEHNDGTRVLLRFIWPCRVGVERRAVPSCMSCAARLRVCVLACLMSIYGSVRTDGRTHTFRITTGWFRHSLHRNNIEQHIHYTTRDETWSVYAYASMILTGKHTTLISRRFDQNDVYARVRVCSRRRWVRIDSMRFAVCVSLGISVM